MKAIKDKVRDTLAGLKDFQLKTAEYVFEQLYVKNNDMTITDLIKEHIALMGENIVIKRFVRFVLGETEKE